MLNGYYADCRLQSIWSGQDTSTFHLKAKIVIKTPSLRIKNTILDLVQILMRT